MYGGVKGGRGEGGECSSGCASGGPAPCPLARDPGCLNQVEQDRPQPAYTGFESRVGGGRAATVIATSGP